MTTLQQQIATKFLQKLAGYEDLDANKIDQLRALLQEDKKPKPDDFVKIFKAPSGDLA
jgi:hypothetical protein